MSRLVPTFMLALTAGAVACGTPTANVPFPVLDPEKTRQLVAVGYFSSGAHLPEREECRNDEKADYVVLCLDPPPMRLRFRLLETLYGEPPPDAFPLFTPSSHQGLNAVEFGPTYPYLVLIETDGRAYTRSRYYRLARNSRQELALPIWPNGRLLSGFLPCSLQDAIQPFVFTGPGSRVREPLDDLLDPYDPPYLYPGAEIRGAYVYVRQGIPVAQIRSAFANLHVDRLDFDCEAD